MKEIILSGFMGCGKSSIGVLVAEGIPGTEFKDLDDFIEEISGRSIPEIFEEDGEEGFRQIEEAALDSLLMIDSDLGQRSVIALGGGTLCTPGCRSLVRDNGICFYLKASPETLEKSLTEYPGERPMLDSKLPLRARIEELLDERSSTYEECADHVIMTDGRDYHEIAEEILSLAGCGFICTQ